MQVHWRKLWFKTILWLAAEILLTLIGLDNLADYSEFVFGDASIGLVNHDVPQVVSLR